MSTTEYASGNRIQSQFSSEHPDGRSGSAGSPLKTFLGLFSIGLGLAEVLKTRSMQQITGVHHPGILKAYGVREITSGIGVLTSDRPAFWLWSRVAGDAIDLATLAAAYAEGSSRDRARILQSAAAVAGVTILDILCAREHARNAA